MLDLLMLCANEVCDPPSVLKWKTLHVNFDMSAEELTDPLWDSISVYERRNYIEYVGNHKVSRIAEKWLPRPMLSKFNDAYMSMRH